MFVKYKNWVERLEYGLYHAADYNDKVYYDVALRIFKKTLGFSMKKAMGHVDEYTDKKGLISSKMVKIIIRTCLTEEV